MLNTIYNQDAQNVYVFGVSHQTAPTMIREQFSFHPEEALAALRACQQAFDGAEVGLLSTCNRTEFYLISPKKPNICQWIAKEKGLDLAMVSAHAFSYSGREAVRHLFRVACGLDSMILGESQILGQMKDAHRLARQAHTLGSTLDRLFQQTFAIAKQIRHTTAIGANPVSVAYAGVKLTHQFFDDHPRRVALIIGAGDTAQLVARYLRDCGINRLIIANRTLANAQTLAEEVGGYAICLSQLKDHLHEADMVFGTARADNLLLTQQNVKQALKARRNHLQVYIDLAIPRNFDSDIAELNAAFLYGLDDLEQIIDDNVKARQSASSQAEIMVNLYSDDFLGWLYSKPQQQLVRKIRDNANHMRQQLLQDAYRRLAHGDDPAAILEQLSYRLTNKLLHNPSALIHAIPPDHKDWLAIVADTFKADN